MFCLKSINKAKMKTYLLIWSALMGLFLPEKVFAVTYAYIPNQEANTVSVIRTSDNALIQTIAVGNGPFGVAYSPSGDYVYVTNRKDGTVSVINTSENQVTDTVRVGNEPMGIATGVGGAYIFVANHLEDTVSIITASGDEDNNVLTTIAVGNQPYGIATDPDGEYIYVSNYGDGTVTVFSFVQDPVSIPVGQGPLGIAVDKAGEYVYVANNLDNTVTVINVEGENRDNDDDDEADDDNQVVGTIPVGKGPWGVSVLNNVDADYADSVFVTNNSEDTVSIIDVSSLTISNRDASALTVTATLQVGSSPMGVSVPLNGDFAYVVNNGADTVSVIAAGDHSLSTFSLDSGGASVGLGNFIGGPAPDAPYSIYDDDRDDDSIDLVWIDYSFNELGFILERREYDSKNDNEFEIVAVLGANVTEYTDKGLDSSETYEYRIKAYNEAADSEYTSVYSVKTEGDDANSGCFIRSLFF